MKKSLLSLLFTVFHSFSFSQNITFYEDEFVWFGLDFSHVKLIGNEGFNDVGEIKDYYFDRWNNLLIEEYAKYNLKAAYNKNTQYDNLSVVNRRNDQPRVSSLVSTSDYDLSEEEVQKIISNYEDMDKDAELGLVFIVETLNKSDEHAKVDIVFFEIATGKIFWSKEFKGKPGGFGFRNYWLGAFYSIIKESSRHFKKDAMRYKREAELKD